jgi:predicted acetyltransferase
MLTNNADPLNIEVRLAAAEERPILRRLMELYLYDFSEFDGADLGPLGLYDYPFLDLYWTEEGRFPYLVRLNGQLAGFVLVSRYSVLTGNPDAWVMAEFFILRKYRHRGIGEWVARWVFDQHPGAWQVSEIPQNQAAVAFWRKVVARYSGGNFEEQLLNNERWQGPVQFFTAAKQPNRASVIRGVESTG